MAAGATGREVGFNSVAHIHEELTVLAGKSRTWVGPVGGTHRMEPELDNGSVVELVYLAAHGDEAVAVLNLLDVFFPGRLCGDLTEHRLGWEGGCEPTEEGVRSARWLEKKRGIGRREVGDGGKVAGGTREGNRRKEQSVRGSSLYGFQAD